MKLIIALLCLAAAPAFAANKCTMPNGQIEYQDAPCSNQAVKQDTARERRNSIDSSHGAMLDRQAVAAQECDAARESFKHNPTVAYRDAARRACGTPPPVPSNTTRTVCSTSSFAGSGSAHCVTKPVHLK